MILPPYKHQTVTTDFIVTNNNVLITSDPGTGKTRSVLDAVVERKRRATGGRVLVFAPLSILEASWVADCNTFTPDLAISMAPAGKRDAGFAADSDIVVVNHDGVKWVDKNVHVLDEFDTLVLDEFTAFKNKDSARSKAMLRISKRFDYRIAMSGTPNSNTILDIWHPAMIVDGGKRLGNKFYNFRGSVCTPLFNGFANEWKDKPDAIDTVAAALSDITIRYALEDCLSMPERTTSDRRVTLSPAIREQYEILMEDAVLYTTQGTVNAVHAGAKIQKLLQLCTGTVYDSAGEAVSIHKERYELVMSLVAERKHSLVAFNWRHEREALVEIAECEKIKYAVIDGTTPSGHHAGIVQKMQNGELQVIFAHPQSAAHGLTLTKATAVIWSSPTYRAELYKQFNGRIYRAGQKKRTEVIHIAARNTFEEIVYSKLQTKMDKMEDLLLLLKNLHIDKGTK